MILASTPYDIRYFHYRTQYAPTPNFRGMKTTDDVGRIRAMVGFDNWTPNGVQMHICIEDKKGFTRGFIREIFTYLFVTCKKTLVMAVIASDNAACLELTERVGFREVHRVEDGWSDGVDLVVKEMRYFECRWLRKH